MGSSGALANALSVAIHVLDDLVLAPHDDPVADAQRAHVEQVVERRVNVGLKALLRVTFQVKIESSTGITARTTFRTIRVRYEAR